MDSAMCYDIEGGDSPLVSPSALRFDQYMLPRLSGVDETPSFDYGSSYGSKYGDPSLAGSNEEQFGRVLFDLMPTGDATTTPYLGMIDPSIIMANMSPDSSIGSPHSTLLSSAADQDSPGGLCTVDPPGRARKFSRSSSNSNSSTGGKKRKHKSSLGTSGRGQNNQGNNSGEIEPPRKRTASGPSPVELKAREAHNQVEKQYRERLNWYFERLLAVLPGTGCEDDGLSKRISKAEVLDRARRRIKTLEKETASLAKERQELAEALARLQTGRATKFGQDGAVARPAQPEVRCELSQRH